MKAPFTMHCFVFGMAFLPAFLLGNSPNTDGPPPVILPIIELSDQFGNPYRYEAPLAKPLFLTSANNRGSKLTSPWINQFYAEFGSTIEIIGIADLRGAPRVMHPALKLLFREQCPDYPILLDWKGKITSLLARSRSGLDVFVISPEGAIVAAAEGEHTSDKAKPLQEHLRGFLQAKQGEGEAAP
ncbi:MAG: hypothetical protein AAF191_09415 [Verrucomicrobiota bacterium]